MTATATTTAATTATTTTTGDMAEAFAAHGRWIVGLRADFNRRIAEAEWAAAEAVATGSGLVYMMENVEIEEPPVYRGHSALGSEGAHEAGPVAVVEEEWNLCHPPLVHRQSAFRE